MPALLGTPYARRVIWSGKSGSVEEKAGTASIAVNKMETSLLIGTAQDTGWLQSRKTILEPLDLSSNLAKFDMPRLFASQQGRESPRRS